MLKLTYALHKLRVKHATQPFSIVPSTRLYVSGPESPDLFKLPQLYRKI